MNFLKLLEPESIIILGVIWILREVFGFLHKYKGRNGNGPTNFKAVEDFKNLFLDVNREERLTLAINENTKMLNKILNILGRIEAKLAIGGEKASHSSPTSQDTRN